MMKPLLLFTFCIGLLCAACNGTETATKPASIEQAELQLCFGSVSPNANRATPLYDYLKFSIRKDGQVEGMGGGFVMAGAQRWISNIKGTQSGDSLKLLVTYEVENPEYEGYRGPFTSSETWFFGPGRERLFRKDCAALKNWMGLDEYYHIEAKEIPEDVASRLRKISLR
jgi:hypothetical protein